MGARVNFVFDDGTESLVVLYSHWGAETWQDDLAGALDHAQNRKGDHSYFTRMVISHLIKDEILMETGFGIYAIGRDDIGETFDKTVVLDLLSNTVTDLDNQETIPFYGQVRELAL
jgi:hypothetical protein